MEIIFKTVFDHFWTTSGQCFTIFLSNPLCSRLLCDENFNDFLRTHFLSHLNFSQKSASFKQSRKMIFFFLTKLFVIVHYMTINRCRYHRIKSTFGLENQILFPSKIFDEYNLWTLARQSAVTWNCIFESSIHFFWGEFSILTIL